MINLEKIKITANEDLVVSKLVESYNEGYKEAFYNSFGVIALKEKTLNKAFGKVMPCRLDEIFIIEKTIKDTEKKVSIRLTPKQDRWKSPNNYVFRMILTAVADEERLFSDEDSFAVLGREPEILCENVGEFVFELGKFVAEIMNNIEK